ncbi:2-methylisocitrate lyase, mitochondrial [Sphaceloma murrayae]|uniref:2-methylisocitrate lyase, mitochondrial n=1 Tax=Sphaceloma murrayae TaxID=2082308 RepID=A0A2K1QP62_9PEZI|nr:2-methylisocitrate lyase, mitochondrial [Sphaceloma murrayae]
MATSVTNGGGKSAWRPASSILREQLADESHIVVCPGVYDGLTARIALDAGFKTLYMTGAGTSASVLGSPDLALITLPEMHGNASMIASLDPSVPVVADADTGFGGPLSVARTVKAYINSNIAALHIEDQAMNKRCGHLSNKELVSTDVFVTRMRAAVMARAQTGRDIVLIARTDALQSLGFDEAVARLRAAIDVGADVAFLEGVLNEQQAKDVCKALAPTPCLVNIVAGGVTPIWSAKEATSLGFRIMIWPIISLTAVYNSTKQAMAELRDTGTVSPSKDGAGGVRDIFEVCGLKDCASFDREAGGSAYSSGV